MAKDPKDYKRPVNPKSLANLKPYPKGTSGNPGGKRHKLPLTDRYADRIEEKLPEKFRKWLIAKAPPLAEVLIPGSKYGDMVVIAQILQAAKGKTEAAKEIREAIEGKSIVRLRQEMASGMSVEAEGTDVDDIKKRIAEMTERIRERKK